MEDKNKYKDAASISGSDRLKILEDRLENIDDMLVHMHGHLEVILQQIEFHDMRLSNLADLLLKEYSEDEIYTVSHPHMDVTYEEECYTPINDKDEYEHIKKLQELRDASKGIMRRKLEQWRNHVLLPEDK